MRKVLFILACVFAFSASTKANNFKLDDAKVDAVFAQSEDVSASLINSENASIDAMFNTSAVAKGGDQKVSGYLVRAWFCGFIGLHRYYMGCGDKPMWAYYFCIPIAGEIAIFVDFWWVVFNSSAMDRYKDNDKYWVFLK